ncbi:NAD(P)/FAD-dependent oxidoreductase [Ruegeria marina]|uniref:Glycine/D-amino acid oxidase n=1 Tax=Ruegeria marina TaxID=639004 RepID=A0A1G6P0K7_9RHOB|nr:FAD-dependent oxidoreductase [Ruegeria marina]SDC73723.1 Glycine/D-amino acid oxidase [Ruegeria marina]
MRRIFSDFAYGAGPRQGCWWDETIAAPDWPIATGDIQTDVAIVGAGFTGISAALHLAESGVAVTVLEAGAPGWGASGRNGGFCCLGGIKLNDAQKRRRFGKDGAKACDEAEVEAVDLVGSLIARHGINADMHSRGETRLAHSTRAMDALRREADKGHGRLHEKHDLEAEGLNGQFLGGLTSDVGFALNPRKYLFGLADVAAAMGVRQFRDSAVLRLERGRRGHVLHTAQARIEADTVLICTNGYSSEDMPPWLAGRYMPAQSSVMVTRPMSDAELRAQGWTSDQMAYDTRHLLHYFRLMPDRRFLFGMRGGLFSSPRVEARIHARMRRHFDAMFPAWAEIEATNLWSGMVCLGRDLVPYVGPVPGTPGMFAGLAYHGNGVAMGTYSGRALARLALGEPAGLPVAMQGPLRRFPLGRFRRVVMQPAYLAYGLADQL